MERKNASHLQQCITMRSFGHKLLCASFAPHSLVVSLPENHFATRIFCPVLTETCRSTSRSECPLYRTEARFLEADIRIVQRKRQVTTHSGLLVAANINKGLMARNDPKSPFPVFLGRTGRYCSRTFRLRLLY